MALYNTNSMYRNTAIINDKLDIFEPESNFGNIYSIVIESKYHNRPDLLANDLYGNAKLWWVFAQLNQDTLVDPILDFVNGLTIVVPENFS
jgi:hypothetical protein